MNGSEKIKTRHGDIDVRKSVKDDKQEVNLYFHIGMECVIHWGLSRGPGREWMLPPEDMLPEKTLIYNDHAVQTSISQGDSIHIKMEVGEYAELVFALYYPEHNRWDNNHGRDYHIRISETVAGEKMPVGLSDKDLRDVADIIIQNKAS